MRARGFGSALAAPLVLWGGVHVAGPRLWTLVLLAPVMLVAWWRDGTAECRTVTRPGVLLAVSAFVWCLLGFAAGLAGFGLPRWWLLPGMLAPAAAWWWVAVIGWWPRVEPDPEPEEEPARRPFVVVDRTAVPEPPVVMPPRTVRLHAAPTVVAFDDDEEDEPEPRDDPGLVLAERIAAAWDGDAAVMHLDELAAAGWDGDKTLLRLDLDEQGVPVDPKARKKRNGTSTPKAGVRREAFEEWRERLSTVT